MSLLDLCPAPPHWNVSWTAMRERFDYLDALHDCPQDPTFHAEGDVGIHTEMALEQLAASDEFRALPAGDRATVFAAVALHDVAKPACTRTESDRITSRGHSARGDIDARVLLWRAGVPFAQREAICGLIRYHQVPFFLVDRDQPDRLAFEVSYAARCDLLALVAWADGAGRRCADPTDQKRILDNVELFRDYCDERHCLRSPREFASAHARFEYFRTPGRDPDYAAFDDTRCVVTLLSGLPAAGKSHWIETQGGGLPVVSLDAIRRELGIAPTDRQGRVIDVARERARVHLRAGEPFIWNATNLSRSLRERVVSLLHSYNARTRIVYREVDEPTLHERNRNREHPVPSKAIDKLLTRWTVPTLVEAHEVDLAMDD